MQSEKGIPKELLSEVNPINTVIQKSMTMTVNDLKNNQTIRKLSPSGLFEAAPVQQTDSTGKGGLFLPSCLGKSSIELGLYRTASSSLSDISLESSFAHASESVETPFCHHKQIFDKPLLESDNLISEENSSPLEENRAKINTFEEFAHMFATFFSENSNILASRSVTPQKRQTAKPILSPPQMIMPRFAQK